MEGAHPGPVSGCLRLNKPGNHFLPAGEKISN